MAIYEVKGDLLNTHCNYICHQVNCQGVMGSGVAAQIKKKWPVVYENYSKKFESTINGVGEEIYLPAIHLGAIQLVKINDTQHVINMFAQEDYGYNGKRYTSYEAFWSCLSQIRAVVPEYETIAFPYKIGSDRGGANWNVIYTMIQEQLGNYEVFIYKLEGNK